MKRLLWVVLCPGLLLIGCGTQVPLSGKAFDDYMKSIKPYGTYWVKEGMTVEQRRRDSWACGAAPSNDGADDVVFIREKIKAEMRPEDKDDFAAQGRLSRAWVECMKAKGYEYHRTVP